METILEMRLVIMLLYLILQFCPSTRLYLKASGAIYVTTVLTDVYETPEETDSKR